MKLIILLSSFLVVSCAKKSHGGTFYNVQMSPSSNQSPEGKERQNNTGTTVELGRQINIKTTEDQPLIGLRYSKSIKDQFDFNFVISPSELGVSKPEYITHVFIRLVSKRTYLPLTQWYFQRSLGHDKVNPDKDLFIFQPLYTKSEAAAAIAQMSDLVIQLTVRASEGPESGTLYWIDLGKYCTTFPQNYIETDSIVTGCN